MRHHRTYALVLLVVAVLLLASAPAQAAENVDVSFRVGCTGYSANRTGSIRLTRDNTGAGRETFVISAVDGAGTPLLDSMTDSFFIGGTVTWQEGDAVRWTTAPSYNPIALTIFSPSGNTANAALIHTQIGVCRGLPTLDTSLFNRGATFMAQLTSIILPADGHTDPPVPLNSVPPRPINPEGLAELRPGYGVVATDNLYLRSGPGVEYAAVGIVDGGTRLVMLGRNGARFEDTSDLLWWYVQVGGMRGWVKSTLLILRGNLTGVPVVPAYGELNVPTFYVGYDGNPIFSNSRFARTVCGIPSGMGYRVLGRNENGSAIQILGECNGEAVLGWVRAEVGILRNPGGVDIPVTG